MSSVEFTLFAIGSACVFIACILFVVFGQVTVRKLRKNPAVKDDLGFEFASGWDIINVAHALSMPLWLSDKLQEGSLSFLEANARSIKKHINQFDLFLARAFCFFQYSAVLIILPLVILDAMGFWDMRWTLSSRQIF